MNEVRTVFEVDTRKAFADADKLKSTYADVDKAGAKVGSSFANGLDQTSGKLKSLIQDLTNVSAAGQQSSSRLWQSYQTGANQTIIKAQALQKELRDIRTEAAKTVDPKALNALNQRLAETAARADALQRKMNNVTQSRVDIAGKPVSANALGNVTNAAQQLGIPGANEAQQVIELAQQAGIVLTTSTVAIGAAGAAAIGAVALATAAIVKEANVRLKSEEKITIEYGRQQKILFDIKKDQYDFNKQRGFAEQERQFGQDTAGASRDALERRRTAAARELERLQRYGGLEAITQGRALPVAEIQQKQSEILKLDALISQASDSSRKFLTSAGTDFQARSSQVSKQLQTDIEAAKKDVPKLRALLDQVNGDRSLLSADRNPLAKSLTEKIDELVKGGVAKVEEFKKKTQSIFEDLQRSSAGSNPFVTLFLDADKAMQALRENTKGVRADIRETFEGMLRQQNQLKLFSTQVDNNLSALELRQRAKALRGFADTSRQDQLKYMLELEKRVPSGNLRDIYSDIGNPGDSQYGSRNGNPGLGGTGNPGFAIFDAQNAAFRKYAEENRPQVTVNDRLDEQLKVLKESGAKTEEEKALIDRKILGLASGDPSSLTGEQRNVAAAAAEREAVRKENYERTALQTALDHLGVSRAILEQNKSLLGVAQKQGIKGVETLITVKDKTEAGIEVKTQVSPKPKDTADLYGGFGIAGGTNQ